MNLISGLRSIYYEMLKVLYSPSDSPFPSVGTSLRRYVLRADIYTRASLHVTQH